MFEVILAAGATRFYERCGPGLQRRLDRCFDALRRDPRHHNNIKPLKGSLAGLLRFRVGDWRVLYRIDDRARQVAVLDIAHRREIYE